MNAQPKLGAGEHGGKTKYGIVFIGTAATMLFPFYIGGPILLAATIYLAWQERAQLKQTIKHQGWLGIFIVYAIIVALYYRNYVGVLATVAVALIALFFYYYRQYLTVDRFLQILKLIAWGSIPLVMMAIFQYLFYVWNNGYDAWYIFKYHNPQTRAEATFFNANYYGLYCTMAILVAMYLAKTLTGRKEKFLSVIAIAGNSISIILTASRLLLPTVVVGVLWLVFYLNRKYAIVVFLIGLVGGGLLLMNPEVLPRLTTLDYAFKDRFILWGTGWNIFLTSPLVGRGALSYLSYYYLFVDRGQIHAHQMLIDTLANYGLLGLFILTNAFTGYFRQLMKDLNDSTIRFELGLITSIIIVVLMHGLMDMAIYWLQTGFVFLAIILCPPTILRELAQLRRQPS